MAKGEYVKILHHDDWFRDPSALALTVAALDKNPDASFVFSTSVNIFPNNTESPNTTSPRQLETFNRRPESLLLRNFIGAPSVVTFRRYPQQQFDPFLKWLVDIDFYIALRSKGLAVYIEKPLLNIGVHSMQVTEAVQHDPAVVLPEWAHVFSKDPTLRIRAGSCTICYGG